MTTFLLRNLLPITFIFAVTSIFVIFANETIPNYYFVSAMGALVTLYLGIQHSLLNDDKIFKTLFNEFNERYDRDLNDLINEIARNREFELTVANKNTVIDYLNLSAEEYFWYKKGRIPEDVWQSWKNGIEANLRIPQLHEVVSVEHKYYENSYYGLFDEINFKPNQVPEGRKDTVTA